MIELGCTGGCYSTRASYMASFIGASVSSEQASLAVPLKSPSSSLTDTRVASESSRERWLLLLWDLALGGGSTSSCSCLLMAVARDQLHPPLPVSQKNRHPHFPYPHAMNPRIFGTPIPIFLGLHDPTRDLHPENWNPCEQTTIPSVLSTNASPS